jgi:hypothetical protein
MKQLTALSLALLLCGCARFSTKQTDITYEEGQPAREITTTATATTFAASKTALAKWKASQSDSTQGASVGALDQESDASKLLDAVVQAAVKAGAATVKP